MFDALRSERLRLLASLVAVLLVTSAIPAAAVAEPAADADPKATFDEKIHHEQRGDVLEIGVSLSGTDAATLRVGPDANDSATVVVRDEDGDGRATVLLNTYDSTFRASDGDALTVREPPSGPLVPEGDHRDVVAHPGNGTDRDPTDIGTLVVSERTTEDLRAWAAPESADLSDLREIHAAMAAEDLTRTDAVARNDTLVLELRASGLEGALAARNESNVTAGFFGLLEGGPADLEVVQINPGPSIPPKEIHLAPDSTRAVADARNDSYYLVADLPDANVTGRNGELDAGDVYEANLSVAGSSELASNGTESVGAEFEVVESRHGTADSTTVQTTDAPVREETAESPTATADETETADPETDGEIPGFGVGAAVVALSAAALLARRRRK